MTQRFRNYPSPRDSWERVANGRVRGVASERRTCHLHLEHVRRRGAGEEEALHFFAALLAEELELGFGLDAFGGDAEVEAVGHRDDGGDDGAVAGAPLDLVDEGLVDLDAVDREAAEVVE